MNRKDIEKVIDNNFNISKMDKVWVCDLVINRYDIEDCSINDMIDMIDKELYKVKNMKSRY